MQQAEKILDEMEGLLDRLIETAKKLLILSEQVIEEEELNLLQQEQEELLAALIKNDEEFHHHPDCHEKLMPQRLNIDKKIDHFQKLNADFVENISTAHGLIQFDQGIIKKRKKSSTR